MKLFKPTAFSPKQIERRRKIQGKGRKHYIFYRGVLGWGGTSFIMTSLWDWHGKFGWRVPAVRRDVVFDISIGLLAWTIAGYIWGAFMWTQMFGKPTLEK